MTACTKVAPATGVGGLHSGVGVLCGGGQPLVGTAVGVGVGGEPAQILRSLSWFGGLLDDVLLPPPPPQLNNSTAATKEITGMRTTDLRSHTIAPSTLTCRRRRVKFPQSQTILHASFQANGYKKGEQSVEGGCSINARHGQPLVWRKRPSRLQGGAGNR
jgi:hypothetical protein